MWYAGEFRPSFLRLAAGSSFLMREFSLFLLTRTFPTLFPRIEQ
jgi:hypothetical protein